MLTDLIDAVPGLGLIGLGVAGIALLGRDRGRSRERDRHSVADYRPDPVPGSRLWEPGTLAPARHTWALVNVNGRRRLRPGAADALELPAVPTATTAHLLLYAEVVVAEVLARYGTSSADIAGRWLAELGEQARAEAVAR